MKLGPWNTKGNARKGARYIALKMDNPKLRYFIVRLGFLHWGVRVVFPNGGEYIGSPREDSYDE